MAQTMQPEDELAHAGELKTEEDLSVQDFQDAADWDDEDDEQSLPQSPHAPFASNSAMGVLFQFAGLGCMTLGVALRFAPKLSWQLVHAERFLSAEGLTPIFVVLVGFVAFGLGFLQHSIGRAVLHVAETPDSNQGDMGSFADKLDDRLAEVHEILKVLGQHLSFAVEQQRTFQEEMSAQFTAQNDPTERNEALFRLAADLDKLHAHLDRDFKDLGAGADTRNQVLSQNVESMGERITQVDSSMKTVLETMRSLPAAITSHAAAFGTPTPITVQPALDTGKDIYSDPPSGQECEAHEPQGKEKPEQTIDTDRLVQEGLEALGQIENGARQKPPVIRQLEPPAALPHPSPSKVEQQEKQSLLSDNDLRNALDS